MKTGGSWPAGRTQSVLRNSRSGLGARGLLLALGLALGAAAAAAAAGAEAAAGDEEEDDEASESDSESEASFGLAVFASCWAAKRIETTNGHVPTPPYSNMSVFKHTHRFVIPGVPHRRENVLGPQLDRVAPTPDERHLEQAEPLPDSAFVVRQAHLEFKTEATNYNIPNAQHALLNIRYIRMWLYIIHSQE